VFRVILPLLVLLFSITGLFLSIWIVTTAPTFPLYPLSVGAPELSPGLLLGNGAIALLILGFWRFQQKSLALLTLSMSMAALALSALPLLQLSAAHQQFAIEMERSLGISPETIKPTNGKSQPFSWQTFFTGIPLAPVRYDADIQFAAPNGAPLKLDLYRPTQVGQHPTVVMIHGGAWQHGSPRDNSSISRYLAGQGYTVVAIAYRLAPRYRFPAQIEDVRSALEFIHQNAAKYEIDLNRMAIMGRSAGAHLAMLAAYPTKALATASPNMPTFRAVVNYYGPVDLTQGYFDPPNPDPIDSKKTLNAFLGGTPDQFPNLYQAASPINFVRPNLPPTLLVYGGRDHIVQAKFGRYLSEQLQASGNIATFLEIPWAEHAFDALPSGISNQLALYYTERFLAKMMKE
jgi:acetyl esterase/lipase